MRAQLRGDVVGRGGVEVGPGVQPHVALSEPRPSSRLAARQHCNTQSKSSYKRSSLLNKISPSHFFFFELLKLKPGMFQQLHVFSGISLYLIKIGFIIIISAIVLLNIGLYGYLLGPVKSG